MLKETEINFDQIKLGNELGRGGFGTVYKATYLVSVITLFDGRFFKLLDGF